MGPILPTVLFGRTLNDDQLDAVTIDNFSASYQATSYLIDLGQQAHRRDPGAEPPEYGA